MTFYGRFKGKFTVKQTQVEAVMAVQPQQVPAASERWESCSTARRHPGCH